MAQRGSFVVVAQGVVVFSADTLPQACLCALSWLPGDRVSRRPLSPSDLRAVKPALGGGAPRFRHSTTCVASCSGWKTPLSWRHQLHAMRPEDADWCFRDSMRRHGLGEHGSQEIWRIGEALGFLVACVRHPLLKLWPMQLRRGGGAVAISGGGGVNRHSRVGGWTGIRGVNRYSAGGSARGERALNCHVLQL